MNASTRTFQRAIGGAAALLTICLSSARQPVEVGEIKWERDLGRALEASASNGRPVFALFQEVPGCAGCKQFGREVLSDPLVVDAIESAFVPLLIHNNKPGKDAEVLKKFNEPAWNYQVVRFLDQEGKDLIPRKDRVWTTGPLAERMVSALETAKLPVPTFLSLLRDEHSEDLQQAAFGMHCFWTGEAKLGAIDGVVTTEAGWIGNKEVTLLTYQSKRLSLKDLVRKAAKVDCAHSVFVPKEQLAGTNLGKLKPLPLKGYRKAKESDQKKQLQGTTMANTNLSPAQATKINAWIRIDPEKARSFLSPRQTPH